MCEYSLPIGRSCIYISSIIISCTLLVILSDAIWSICSRLLLQTPRALTQSDLDEAFAIRKRVSYQKESSKGLIQSDMGKVLLIPKVELLQKIPKAESHQSVLNFWGRIKQSFSNLMVQIKTFFSGIIWCSLSKFPF